MLESLWSCGQSAKDRLSRSSGRSLDMVSPGPARAVVIQLSEILGNTTELLDWPRSTSHHRASSLGYNFNRNQIPLFPCFKPSRGPTAAL